MTRCHHLAKYRETRQVEMSQLVMNCHYFTLDEPAEMESSQSSADTAESNDDSESNSHIPDGEQHKCEFCDHKTSDLSEFNEHIKVHIHMSITDSDGDWSSILETASEDQKDRLHDLIEHIKEQKQSKVEPDSDWEPESVDNADRGGEDSVLQCDCCDYECETQQELDTHLASHTGSGSKSGKRIVRYCKKCNEEFRSLVQLKQHEKAATCNEKVLACDECEFMTTKVESFRGHKRRNHGEIVMKKCKYCSRLFKRQRNLEEHMNTHTGLTPFQCDKCGKAFHTNSSWYKHKRNNCEKGLRERKLCSLCGREVINLAKHISDVHFNIKEFHCETCSKSFGTQYHLDRHVRIHTGEKPFPCSYCDYRASQKVVTDGHMRKCKFKPEGITFNSNNQ